MSHLRIAIDGPAGAGKSTIAKEIAKKLKIVYIDTGAMYRTVAYYCRQHDIDWCNEQAIEGILDKIQIEIQYQNDTQHIYLNGQDVSQEIRTQEIASGASQVAAYKNVRLKLVKLQQALAQKTSVIMDGRDIGTYVLPDAELKIFLTASVRERAQRRYQDLEEKGISTSIKAVEQEIAERDENDRNRTFAPLCKADDAIEVDTTGLTIEQVQEKIMGYL